MNPISRKTILSLACLVALEGIALYSALAGDIYTATPEQSCRATNLALSAQVQQLQVEVEQFKKHDLQVEICSSAKLPLDNCVIESSKDGAITAHAKTESPVITIDGKRMESGGAPPPKATALPSPAPAPGR